MRKEYMPLITEKDIDSIDFANNELRSFSNKFEQLEENDYFILNIKNHYWFCKTISKTQRYLSPLHCILSNVLTMEYTSMEDNTFEEEWFDCKQITIDEPICPLQRTMNEQSDLVVR